MSNIQCPIEFRLERSAERNQPFFWGVYVKGGARKLAYSETYTTRQAAVHAVGVVQAGRTFYRTFRGSDLQWYFHIQGLNNEILARSAFKYTTEGQAKADAELVRLNASEAPFYDYVPVG